VQVRSRGLTLLEGILGKLRFRACLDDGIDFSSVSQLSWLANLGTILALASYSRSKGKDNLVKFAAVLQGMLCIHKTRPR